MGKLDLLRQLDSLGVELAAAMTHERKQLVLAEILARRQAILELDGTDKPVELTVTAAESEKLARWHAETNRDAEARAALLKALGNGALDPSVFKARVAVLDERHTRRGDFQRWSPDGVEPEKPKPRIPMFDHEMEG